jgi:hypothetical protein
MPFKKYWLLLIAFALLVGVNSLLGLYSQNDSTEVQKASFMLDSTLYPKLEVVHITMKPAWYQFFAPTVALPASLNTKLPLAFLPIANKQNPEFMQWGLLNQTHQVYKFPTQNGSLLMLQEAKDEKGTWRPIEYWASQWGSVALPAVNETFSLPPQKAIMIVAPQYKGTFKTDFRFKFKAIDNKGKTVILYSPTFKGSISPTQFDISSEDKKKGASYLD